MATLKNHKITGTPNAAIKYATKDKTEPAFDMRPDVEGAISYARNDKEGTVTYETRSSTINCNPSDPSEAFNRLANEYGRDELINGNAQSKDGRPVIAWHYIQSFDTKVDPELAHEVGRKFAEEVFAGHPVVIGTHTNTEHTHNHFIVCAWAFDGHKWDQCNTAYQHAREVSDRLCDEYGLGVLENTRQQKLVRWTDKEGRTHYYEPTDRKNEMLDRRDAGDIPRDRVGSYRDTFDYEKGKNEKLSNRAVVKRDIDTLLPAAHSYAHLLTMLQEMGYKVNAWKKDGSYLKFVSFTPPTATKGTRDSSITQDGYYARENLTKVIAEYERQRMLAIPEPERIDAFGNMEEIPYVSEYVYGETDFSKVDDNWRMQPREGGGYDRVPRSEAEKSTLAGIRRDDREVRGLVSAPQLTKMIEDQKKYGARAGYVSDKRADMIVRQIQDSCRALTIMEHEGLYNQYAINRVISGLWSQYNETFAEVNRLENTVDRLEDVLKVPELAETIRGRMERGAGDAEYEQFDKAEDVAQLKKCEVLIKRYELDTPDGRSRVEDRIRTARGRIAEMHGVMAEQKGRIEDLDLCARVLNRSDKDFGRDNTDVMKEYWGIDRAGRAAEKTNERVRAERVPER